MHSNVSLKYTLIQLWLLPFWVCYNLLPFEYLKAYTAERWEYISRYLNYTSSES